MPEEPEVETGELQETIQELQEERKERQEEERRSSWTRYIALTTAFLAVFAAIGALESGSRVNEAMIDQIRASDTWNEYQAARQKEILYTLQAEALVDRGAAPAATVPETTHASPAPLEHAPGTGATRGHAAAPEPRPAHRAPVFVRMDPTRRLAVYAAEARRESAKQARLSRDADALKQESEHGMHVHHQFARSVALIQVAIALGAVAALTRMRPVWLVSLVVGVAGIVFFLMGALAR